MPRCTTLYEFEPLGGAQLIPNPDGTEISTINTVLEDFTWEAQADVDISGFDAYFLEENEHAEPTEAKLVESGAEILEDLSYVDEEMLVDMGVPAIKRTKFLKTIQNFLGN